MCACMCMCVCVKMCIILTAVIQYVENAKQLWSQHVAFLQKHISGAVIKPLRGTCNRVGGLDLTVSIFSVLHFCWTRKIYSMSASFLWAGSTMTETAFPGSSTVVLTDEAEAKISEFGEGKEFLISFLSYQHKWRSRFLEGCASDLSNFIYEGADLSFQSCFQSDSDNRTAYR